MGNRRSFIRNSGLLGFFSAAAGSLDLNNDLTYRRESGPDKYDIEGLVKKLFAAIKNGDSKKIEIFLKKEPALKFIQDENGRSLLWLAAMHNRKELFPFLGGNDDKKDIFDLVALGDTSAISSRVKGDVSILNVRNKAGYTPLSAAAECGQGASVETLIGIGASIDSRKADGDMAPIHFALNYPDSDAVSWMIQAILGNGGNPNLALKDGTTPLHMAVSIHHLFSVKMLLRKRADVSAKNEKGKTPADLAINDEMKQVFIKTDADKKDWYITRYYAKGGYSIARDDTYGLPYVLINDFVTNAHFNPEKTKKLLNQIPDLLNSRASWDEIAVEGCTHLGNELLASFLLEKGSPVSVCTATMFGLTQEVKDLISKNPLIINDRGPHDFPLIWYVAIGKEKLDIAEYLVGRGVDINANIRGRSVLSECARRGHADLTEFLIQNGADLNMVSTSSFFPGTPIQIAKSYKEDKVVAVLRKYKAIE